MDGFEQSVAGVASDPFVPTLQTISAPSFQAPVMADGSLQLAWGSLSGVAYQVQYSTNVAQTNWINFGSVITATNSTTTTNAAIGTDQERFYRVMIAP
jgi:hypothetical protein